MRFDVSKYNLVITDPTTSTKRPLQSFDLDELIGKDSLDAAARAAPPGASVNPAQLDALLLNQLIAQSISAVNGEAVMRPYTAWENWSLRTQGFVIRAYHRLNGATNKEMDDFLDHHFGAPGGASSPPSSASGPGSPGT